MKKEIKIRISAVLNPIGNSCFKITNNVNSAIEWIFPGEIEDDKHPKFKEVCRSTLKEVISGIKVQGECSFKVEYSDKYMSLGEIMPHDTEKIKFTLPHNDLIMPMEPRHIYLFHELLNKI